MQKGWLIERGRVLTDDFHFRSCPVAVRDGKFAALTADRGTDELRRVDAAGMTVIPGLIDTHFHGALNYCFGTADRDGIRKVAAFEASWGVTSILPAISATSDEFLLQSLRDFYAVMETGTGASRIEGVHLEGPFLSEKYRGGQRSAMLQKPSVEKLLRFWDVSGGHIRILTIAPEYDEGFQVIQTARRLGISVALGHTGADYDTAKAAIDQGATISTHTFNGMIPLHHRAPGVVGAVLTDDRVSCEVIADFVHLHPATVELVCRAKGLERVHLVSDSMFATGMPDGDYPDGDRIRHIRDGICRLDDGRISGSTHPLLYGVKNLLQLGIPLEKAVMTASSNAARAAGIFDHTGSIAVGKRGDFSLLDEKLNVVATFVDGEPVYVGKGGLPCD